MPTISTLTIDVQARTSAFTRGLRTATIGLTALAAGAVFAFRKFEESENVLQQTDAVLKSTGNSANVTAKQVADLADALSAKAGVDDEVIQAGENMLLTFKNIRNEAGAGNDIFNQTAAVSLDLAAGFAAASGSQINLKSATIQLGKALNDPIAGMSALTRVGVQFSEEQKKQIEQLVKHNNLLGAQKVILAEVSSQFAGSAEAQATASGRLSVAFENLAEAVGAILAPAIETLVGWLTSVADWFTNLDEGTQTFITTAGGAAVVVGVLAKAFSSLLLPAIRTVIAALTLLAAHPVVAALIAFGAIVALVATKWDDLHGAIKTVLIIFAPVAVALGLLIRNFDEIKEAVIRFGEAVVDWFSRVGDWIGRAVGWIRDRLLGAWKAIEGPVLAVINAIITAVQTLVGWIKDAIDLLALLNPFGGGPPAGGFSGKGGIPVPAAQAGGFVARSGLAVIHRGENIIPAGNGMGRGDIVLQIDGQTFARITRDQLRKLGNRNAGTGL